MAGEFVKLKLRDMYAIKHALQNVLRQKKSRVLEIINIEVENGGLSDSLEVEYEKLDKDIAHEEGLIEKFEEEITEFKDKYNLLNSK